MPHAASPTRLGVAVVVPGLLCPTREKNATPNPMPTTASGKKATRRMPPPMRTLPTHLGSSATKVKALP